MGYACYVLPDGREAGYAVEAQCDEPNYDAQIDRGLGYLCGKEPGGDEYGCGGYFCERHNFGNRCTRCPGSENGGGVMADGMVAILAGNAREAEDYRREMGWTDRDAFYASSVESVVGRRVRDVHMVDTWRTRRDAEQMLVVLAHAVTKMDLA